MEIYILILLVIVSTRYVNTLDKYQDSIDEYWNDNTHNQ